jgi:signal transduction histidine kinase
VIARRLHQIADADAVNVVLPTPDGQHLVVEIATGEGADQLAGLSYPIEHTVSQLVIENGRPVLVGDIGQEPQHTVHLSQVAAIGPLMVLPLVGTQRVRGALIVGRLAGRARFTAAELEMATTFANQAAVAVELADARADQQRVSLLEDRDRIGRDLHDHVIQRLFGVGLTVESIASGLTGDPRGDRLAQLVTDIDATIRQIRTTIFQLRGPLGPYTGGVRAQVLEVVAELAGTLGFRPSVTFTGPVDSVVPDELIGELSAVVREALSNTARHARASKVTLSLSVGDDGLCLEVADDGVGIGETERRSGLANLRERAALHQGTLVVTSPCPDRSSVDHQGGTSVRWTIPLN